MEFNKNLSFASFFIYLVFVATFGNDNLDYTNISEYLLDSKFQFVEIKNSIFHNKLIFIIFSFIPLNLLITSKYFRNKYIKIISLLITFYMVYTFFDNYIFITKLIYICLILILIIFVYLIFFHFKFQFYNRNLRIKLEHILKLLLIVLLIYVCYFPIFHTYDLDIFLSWFNIHNYSLSGIFVFNEKSSFINTNYYNNFYNFFFRIFFSITHLKFFLVNINIFLLILSSIIFYLYYKIMLFCNKNFKNNIIIYLFLIISVIFIYNFNNPALQLPFRYLIIFVYLFLIINIKSINYFNLSIFVISILSFFHNIESFVIINCLNLILFLNFDKFLIKKIICYILFTLLILLSTYFSIKLLSYFYIFDFTIYKNIIVGSSNGFARSFPRLDNFSILIYLILSHSCSIIIYDFKNLISRSCNFKNRKIINICISILILYFTIFYFRRGYNSAHTDIIIVLYFILLSQQINLVSKFFFKLKNLNIQTYYLINFPNINFFKIFDISFLFTKPILNNLYNLKIINIYSLKIFFISSVLISNIFYSEFTPSSSAFNKYQIKNYTKVLDSRNTQSDQMFNETVNFFADNKIQVVFSGLNHHKKVWFKPILNFDNFSNITYNNRAGFNIPQLDFSEYFLDNNNHFSHYDFVFGVTHQSNVLNPKFINTINCYNKINGVLITSPSPCNSLPSEYSDNLKPLKNFLPNFDIFTNITYNNLAGFNIPHLDYGIIKKKADFLKDKHIYYISDYSFFISLYNREISDFLFSEPFNDLLSKEAFNSYIKKIITSYPIIAIDCVAGMANVKGKVFYDHFLRKLLDNNYVVSDKCNDSGFTILIPYFNEYKSFNSIL